MSIQEHLNKIRNAIKGSEVRESIAKGIETAYDDASEKDNANMEVKIARGTHPNLRSRLEEVDNKQQQTTAQLAQKVNNDYFDFIISSVVDGGPRGVFYSISSLESAFPNGEAGTYLVFDSTFTEGAHTFIWDKTSWVDLGLYQAKGSNQFLATNLIKNGDFTTTANWIANNSTNSVSNNVLTNTGDGNQSFSSIHQAISGLKVGHKYYIGAKVRIKNSSVELFRVDLSEKTGLYSVDNPLNNNTYDVGAIVEASGTQKSLYFTHYYSNNVVANGKQIELLGVSVVDITDVFGSGNEPELDVANQIFSKFPNKWFGGTVNLIDTEGLYRIISKTFNPIKPLIDLDLNGFLVKKDGEYLRRSILGTTGQIEVSDSDGIDYHPKISIPKGATNVFTPEVLSTSYGNEIAPPIEQWIGNNSEWSSTDKEWTVEPSGTIETDVDVIEGALYQIDIEWNDTNFYDEINTPFLIVSLGSSKSDPQFTGYSDALYKVAIKANETGTVKLKLGDGLQDWSAKIANVSVKRVLEHVTRAGRLGTSGFDLTTQGDNFAIGTGNHANRTSGTSNTAIGYNSQTNLTTGRYNTAVGVNTQTRLTSGLNNVAYGFNAQRFLETGYYNIGIGYSAQQSIKNGSWNIGIGNENLRDLEDGHRNTSLGSRALNSLVSGNNNVAMGRQAGFVPKGSASRATISANNQTMIGMQSGQSSSVQADNLTTLGFQAIGSTNATALGAYTEALGVGSVAIGLDSDGNYASAVENDDFVLGTERHHVKVPGKLNITQYTPISSSDPQGEIGDITTDDNFIYVKTTAGWKRNALETF